MNIILCDDSPEAIRLLAKMTQEIMERHHLCGTIKTICSPAELLKSSKKLAMDVLLLDIDMPQINGLEVAKELRESDKKLLIIFVTGMDNLVYSSLAYRPFRFIRKAHLEELEEVLIAANDEVNQNTETFTIPSSSVGPRAFLLKNIIYFESQRNDIVVVTENEEIKFRGTINEIESVLKGKGFVKIYRNLLVNLHFIDMIEKQNAIVRWDKKSLSLPISRNYQEVVLEAFIRLER